MPEEDDKPHYTEPELIHCLFVSGAAVEIAETFVRIIVWTDMPSVPGERHERRIVARLVFPLHAAVDLAEELRRAKPPRRRH